LPQRISALRDAPIPLRTAMVGAIPHLFLMTTIFACFLRTGSTTLAQRSVIVLSSIWVCNDILALNLVVRLAGRWLTEGAGNASPGGGEFLGPLASTVIFAGFNVFSVGAMWWSSYLPQWGAILILLALLSAAAFQHRRSLVRATRGRVPAGSESREVFVYDLDQYDLDQAV